MNDERFPGWLDLLRLWLGMHYPGKPVVVFCGVLAEHVKLLQRHFKGEDIGAIINAEYAILPCDTVDDATLICNETPDGNPFTLVWDGKEIVHENT